SQQLSATLKDFAAGSFSNCAGPAVDTQLKDASNNNVSLVPVGTPVHDTATLTGTITGTPKETLTYTIYSDSCCTTPTLPTATVPLHPDGPAPDPPGLS